jgi:dihydroorotate dehydrogenase electron transfer subunit
VDAVLGFRDASRLLLLDEFQSVCGRLDIATDDGSFGEHCFTDALVRRRLAEGQYSRVLACGPRQMLKAVAAAAKEAGVSCQVSMEERMGCGVGACLVCACKKSDGNYAHVCKDGPVFDASEVDWDA